MNLVQSAIFNQDMGLKYLRLMMQKYYVAVKQTCTDTAAFDFNLRNVGLIPGYHLFFQQITLVKAYNMG